MNSAIDFATIDRLINNAGIGSFELDFDPTVAAPQPRKVSRPKPVRVSPDFVTDLDFAGRRVQGALSELISMDKGLDAVLSALTGQPASDLTPEVAQELTTLVRDFADGHMKLRFLPAVNAATPQAAGGVHTLPHGCACAMETDLTTAYVSADLGFRDLVEATQSAVVKGLILNAESTGAVTDPVQAFADLSALLGHEVEAPEQAAMMEEIWLGSPAGRVPAYGAAFV